jgi:aminoglycoside phosphotransferase (APT) family kinase protein
MSPSSESPIAVTLSHNKIRLATDAMSVWATRLERFMNAKPDSRGQVTVSNLVTPKEVGGSSGTILFTATYSNSDDVEKLVLRFHTEGSHANYSNIVGQYRLLKALQETDVPSPRVTELDNTGHYLGVPGFLMRCIDGTTLPPTYDLNGPLFDAGPKARRQMVYDALGALVKLHRVDWRQLNLDKFTRHGDGDTVIESDINWYWRALLWGVPDLVAVMQPVRKWLLENQVEPKTPVICHGDSSLQNYMYKQERLVGMLDWEFASIGAPETDLAFQICSHEFLTLGNPPLPGMPTGQEHKEMFEQLNGSPLEHWNYHFAFGFYKMYIHIALAFRGTPADLDAARDKYLTFVLTRLNETLDVAKCSQ